MAPWIKKSFVFIGCILILLSGAITLLDAKSDDTASDNLYISSSFVQNGYSISTAHLADFLLSDDSFTLTLTESNIKDADIDSTICISAKWESPDGSAIFGNKDRKENAVLMMDDGLELDYHINADGSISFQLPPHSLIAGEIDKSRFLTVQFPDSLKTIGSLYFTYDEICLQESGGSYTDIFFNEELNENSLDFSIGVSLK